MNCMRHEPRLRRFVNRLDDGRVILKLQSACDETQDARLIWRVGARQHERPLEYLGHVNGQEFFSATLTAKKPVQYAFKLHACGLSRWLTPRGLKLDSAEPDAWFEF